MTEGEKPLEPEDWKSRWIKLDKGTEVIISIPNKDSIVRDYSAKFKLHEEKYSIKIITEDKRQFSINAWGLWNKIRNIITREKTEDGEVVIEYLLPVKLKIKRGFEKGEYWVEKIE